MTPAMADEAVSKSAPVAIILIQFFAGELFMGRSLLIFDSETIGVHEESIRWQLPGLLFGITGEVVKYSPGRVCCGLGQHYRVEGSVFYIADARTSKPGGNLRPLAAIEVTNEVAGSWRAWRLRCECFNRLKSQGGDNRQKLGTTGRDWT